MSPAAGDTTRVLCVTVLGSGFAPFASGTFGSTAAIILFVPIHLLLAWWGAAPVWTEAVLIGGAALATALCVRLGDWAIARFGRKDPKPFVLDELAGQWVALLLLLPPGLGQWKQFAVVLAMQFFWFRLFDVLKPPPARQLERLPGGLGIVMDDLFAGLYANLAGQLIWHATPLRTWVAAL